MAGARIGADCKLGKCVYVDTDVHIGNRVKIQNGISVYKGVTLEDERVARTAHGVHQRLVSTGVQ